MRTFIAILSAAVMLALGGEAGLAQDRYPDRAVKIIVPTSPGATTDVLARSIGQALSDSWKVPVIVDNRPGADEMIGDEIVAKAAPDGYTLGVISNAGITASPQLHKDVRYDPQKDFTPIFMLGEITPVMVVPAKSSVRTVQDLIALAKSKPGELNYGSFGNGTYAHVAMEDFKQRTGIRMTHIPYRGATPAYLALMRDEVAVMIGNLGSANAQAAAGNLRIIAAASAHRSKFRPDLPTIAESGVPGFSTGAWWGMFGPAHLPEPVIANLRAGVSLALETPALQKFYATNTMEREDMTAAQLVAFIREDTANWTRQIKAAGIKPE
ncbi:MAG: tripartite tricarboxylate transporter substrate-binding protein [Xanthobacteraceae bacterium]